MILIMSDIAIKVDIMRKIILTILLAVVSNNAMAKWIETGGSKTLTTYYDPATIRKNGNKVKMWNLYDYKIANESSSGKPYWSQMEQVEYDCKEEQYKIHAGFLYSGNMREGEEVYFNPDSLPSKWLPIAPGSIAEWHWKIACGVK